MRTLYQDIRYGFRMLVRNPGFASIAIFILALGIGANSAIFSIVNGVLLRPLPFHESDRLVTVYETYFEQGLMHVPVAPPNYLDWEAQNHVFEDMAAVGFNDYNFSGSGQPERVQGLRVSSSLFSLLRTQPILGRIFTPEEDQYGQHQVVILSHGFWKRRFGADPAIIGKAVSLDDSSYTVVGIMSPHFQFLSPHVDLWVPIAFNPSFELANRGQHSFEVVGRLKPGIVIEDAQAEFGAIAKRLELQFPDSNKGWGIELQPLQERGISNVRPMLLILLGAVGFVLLIVCANVANLLLARANTRQKEFAIRVALGASQLRTIRQLLTESLALAMCGGCLGLLIAYCGIDALISLSPENLPRVEQVQIDKAVLAFVLSVSALTGIIFGLAPALQVSRFDLNEFLKEGRHGSTGGGSCGRLRSLLVVSQVGLSLLLLISAGLMVRSFLRLHQVDPGFRSKRLLTMDLSLPQVKYPETQQRVNFIQGLLQKIENLPGVQSTSAVRGLPLSGQNSIVNLSVVGRHPLPPWQFIGARYCQVGINYFTTMRIPLIRGRFFTEHDRDKAQPVVIISETMARQFFSNEEPIGQRINIGDGGPNPCEIVGVVGDVKHTGLDTEGEAQMYLPIYQRCWPYLSLVVGTVGDPRSLVNAVRKKVWALDKGQPVHNIRTMEELMSDSVAQRRFSMLLLTLFSGLAVVLAVVGLYGVLSYLVSQRTHEIGIRMALGARRNDVLKLVLKKGLMLIVVGLAIGVAGALALTRVIANQLYGVSPTDPATFMGVSLFLTVVALLACYIPARRATKVDPMTALRYE